MERVAQGERPTMPFPENVLGTVHVLEKGNSDRNTYTHLSHFERYEI